MELANIAFNLGKTVAVAAKNFKNKRKRKPGKYTQFQNEDEAHFDGKSALLRRFLKEAVFAEQISSEFINPFKSAKVDNSSVRRQKDDKEAEADLSSLIDEPVYLTPRTPGDGAETPTTVSARKADGAYQQPTVCVQFHQTPTRKVHTSKNKFEQRIGRGGPDIGKSLESQNSWTAKPKHVKTSRKRIYRKQSLRRVPSLNTGFLQSESCLEEGSLLLTGPDSPLNRGDTVLYSCDEESNVLDRGFVNYGIL